jgi:hypothetical protein
MLYNTVSLFRNVILFDFIPEIKYEWFRIMHGEGLQVLNNNVSYLDVLPNYAEFGCLAHMAKFSLTAACQFRVAKSLHRWVSLSKHVPLLPICSNSQCDISN